jgi:hypothetical protein
VLALSSKLGTLLFFLSLIPIAFASRRWRQLDASMALALTLAMLTYTHAWFQYDVCLIPVVFWIFSRSGQQSSRSSRMALGLGFAFVAIRAMPNFGSGATLELWIQVAARVMLLCSVIIFAENPLPRENEKV